jgi:DNA-binding NtrC family response regulator
MAFGKILVVDDEAGVRRGLEDALRRRGLASVGAASLAEARRLLARESFDLLIVDIRLGDGNGQDLLKEVAGRPDPPMVIMMTGHGSVESAVGCMRAGAFDYLLKPFTPDEFEMTLKRAEEFRKLVSLNRYLSDQREGSELIGHSPPMVRLFEMIERVAPTEATVLVTGESGTGKEMVAREIYRRSPRRNRPFVRVNCAAVSESLIESEFFGHEKGSFTGATERREGRFELADGGTLLLDEVSEIPLHLQPKLLRVLQEQEFERVGGKTTLKVDVRIVATSNRNLQAYVESGSFREDLYYRLNVFPLRLPSLRERGEDALLLAEDFLIRFARKRGVTDPQFSPEARKQILAYPWPGNVRELQNTVERAVILADPGRPVSAFALGLPALDLPSAGSGREGPRPDAILSLEEVERRHILSILRYTGGNRTRAAALLKIGLRTLRNKLGEYRRQGERIPEASGIDR